MKFSELNLDEKVMKGIDDAGFTECTEVQEKAYVYGMAGKDICVQSQTGTGKTAAFLITIFQNLLTGTRTGLSLIIVPTRELAVQIDEEAQLLGSHLNLNIISVYGGVGYNKQEDALRQKPDLIIGTPGRLIDYGKAGKIAFDKVSTLVIDEADRLFDMGFLPDLQFMLRKMPPKEERMTMLFSATLSTKVRHLAWDYMNEPEEVEISPENITVELITQELYHVSKDEKLKILLGLLKRDNPENALVFSNTKHMAVELAWRLSENGYKAQYLMGDLPQKKRIEVLGKLKSGDLQFLVATDVAARGLHINDLAMVVNYDIPEDYENYVHRIGRTARAGKTGKAVTLACEKYVYGLEAIENYISMKIPVFPVDESLLAPDVTSGKVFHDPDRYGKDDRGFRDDRGLRGDRGPRGSRPGRSTGARGSSPARSSSVSHGGPAGRGGSVSRTGAPGRGVPAGSAVGRPADPAGRGKPGGIIPPRPDKPAGVAGSGRVPAMPPANRPRAAAPGTVGQALPENRKPAERKPAGRMGAVPPGREKKPVRNERAKGQVPSSPASRNGDFIKKPKAGATVNDRLAYYRKKYGEDFQLPGEQASAEGKKNGGFLKNLKKKLGFDKKN